MVERNLEEKVVVRDQVKRATKVRFKDACFGIIAGIVGILLMNKAVEPAIPSIGSVAPDFSLIDLSGQKVGLKDLRGNFVLINFWATWCDPCREEMDDLQAIYDRYKDKRFVILGINVKEKEGVVREFAKRFKITYPILLDEDEKVSDAYNVFGIPNSFFIDKESVIRETVTGPMDKERIAEKVDKLMSMKPPL